MSSLEPLPDMAQGVEWAERMVRSGSGDRLSALVGGLDRKSRIPRRQVAGRAGSKRIVWASGLRCPFREA